MRLRRFMHMSRALLAIIAGALPLAVHAQRGGRQNSTQQRIDTTFAFNKAGELSISARRGEVRVTGWARNEARVIATGPLGAITMDASSSRVRLEVHTQVATPTQFE